MTRDSAQEPDVWGDCEGCGRPIRHDEKIVELDYGYNLHGDLMREPDAEPAIVHYRKECVEELRVVPVAEVVVNTVPGIEDVVPSFHIIEDQFDEGFWAVENRLEMGDVPPELEEGYDG